MPSLKREKGRRFLVRRSRIHGKGVFALRTIPKRTIVIEYTGTRISHKKADELFGEEQENSPHTMLFTVNDKIVIDATRNGNSARWINHSCTPNCETIDEKDHIFIETLRTIRPGEELNYDYNLQLGERHTKKAKAAHPCFCGTRNCRGTMVGDRD